MLKKEKCQKRKIGERRSEQGNSYVGTGSIFGLYCIQISSWMAASLLVMLSSARLGNVHINRSILAQVATFMKPLPHLSAGYAIKEIGGTEA
jgi:hypothetical protein